MRRVDPFDFFLAILSIGIINLLNRDGIAIGLDTDLRWSVNLFSIFEKITSTSAEIFVIMVLTYLFESFSLFALLINV